MEFWGVEIKVGKTITVKSYKDKILHISQAAIGEAKRDKGNETAHLYLKVADQKLILGTLSHDRFPQLSLDLVLERECELSHDWKNGSIYLSGYHCQSPEDTFDSDSEEEGNIHVSNVEAKTNTTATEPTEKKQVNFVEAEKDESSDEDDVSDSSGDADESNDDQMLEADGNANDDEISEDDSDAEDSDDSDETPVQTKKRPSDSIVKTTSQKKAKLVTPLKTDDKKKSVHTATPHPAKQAGKASTSSEQAKLTPKSSGSFSCKSCGRSFGSENALQSHSKAKHGPAA